MTRPVGWTLLLLPGLGCSGDKTDASDSGDPACSVEVCDGQDNDCDGVVPELLEHEGRRYLVCHLAPDALSWSDAQAHCAELGMQLVVVDDAAEAAFLEESWAALKQDAVSIPNHMGNLETPAWIGLSDQSGEGDWQWTDGGAAPVDGWCPDEPNDFDEEDCAAMGWTAAYGGEPECPDGGWNDLSCEAVLGFFCEAV